MGSRVRKAERRPAGQRWPRKQLLSIWRSLDQKRPNATVGSEVQCHRPEREEAGLPLPSGRECVARGRGSRPMPFVLWSHQGSVRVHSTVRGLEFRRMGRMSCSEPPDGAPISQDGMLQTENLDVAEPKNRRRAVNRPEPAQELRNWGQRARAKAEARP